MALPSTLHHFDVRLSHVDRGVDRDLSVKAARHPSETLERLWLRLIAYCWQWEESIAFGPGICEPDEPDVVALGPDGSTRTLICRVGRPEVSRIEKDCARGGGRGGGDSTRCAAELPGRGAPAGPRAGQGRALRRCRTS
jgi:uncharacterized protein YaeQ